MASLLTRCGAVPTIAPSMREVPLASNTAAVELALRLARGDCRGALLIFLTGVGAKTLFEAAVTAVERSTLVAAINDCTILIRGPKPVPILREWGVRIDLRAPEPNTWHEITALLAETHTPLAGRTVLVQEYGAPTPELYAWLRSRGAIVETIPVYQWDLPEDLGPLEDAVRRAAAREFDVLMFTSAQQVRHVQQVAERLGLTAALAQAVTQVVLASIGPTTSEAVRDAGWPSPFEPSHSKMGHLAVEALDFARAQNSDQNAGEA